MESAQDQTIGNLVGIGVVEMVEKIFNRQFGFFLVVKIN
jgi:hypothetical protein